MSFLLNVWHPDIFITLSPKYYSPLIAVGYTQICTVLLTSNCITCIWLLFAVIPQWFEHIYQELITKTKKIIFEMTKKLLVTITIFYSFLISHFFQQVPYQRLYINQASDAILKQLADSEEWYFILRWYYTNKEL